MANLLPVGNFRELYPGSHPGTFAEPNLPSIRDAVSETPNPDEEKIVAYLRNGTGVGGRGSYERDVLGPTGGEYLNGSTFTDGTYLWRIDLAYYVSKYHVRLPKEFVDHMAAHGWQPPTTNDSDAAARA